MIAHKLESVRKADTIFVLKDGKIVQSGNHKMLMAKHGVYRDFVNIRQKAMGWSL